VDSVSFENPLNVPCRCSGEGDSIGHTPSLHQVWIGISGCFSLRKWSKWSSGGYFLRGFAGHERIV